MASLEDVDTDEVVAPPAPIRTETTVTPEEQPRIPVNEHEEYLQLHQEVEKKTLLLMKEYDKVKVEIGSLQSFREELVEEIHKKSEEINLLNLEITARKQHHPVIMEALRKLNEELDKRFPRK